MIDGGLFTRDFLLEGICETDVWRDLDDARISSLHAAATAALAALAARRNPNEAETEEDVVYPLLEQLDWLHKDMQPNASAKARHDVPDALLFPDAAAKAAGGKLEPWKRFQYGLCIVEAKRWERALDREEGRRGEAGTPSSQMLRYLRRADDVTKGKLRWGILTNGRVWRLYFHGALSVAEDFLEIDLGKVLDLPGRDLDLLDKRPDRFADDAAWRDHVLYQAALISTDGRDQRVRRTTAAPQSRGQPAMSEAHRRLVLRLFLLLFGREAFLPRDAGETFHGVALREGMRWEAKVARTLSDAVFDVVFPALADALARADAQRPATLSPAYLDTVRQGALILLYRLLFVLYAEDRNLLPDEKGPYAAYCLTRMRIEIAERLGAGATFPTRFATFWPRLSAIFRAIATGDDDLALLWQTEGTR